MTSATLGLLFTLLICLVLPLGLLLALALRPRWRPLVPVYLLGAACFVVSQMLLRLPLLQLLVSVPAFSLFSLAQPILYALLLGLSAGLFEGLSRYGAIRFLLRLHRNFPGAVVLGLGHGGVEALLVAGLPYLSPLFSGLPPGYGFFTLALPGIERIFAILLHVGLSVMVLQAVNRRQIRWLLLAILLHAAADSGGVLLLRAGLPVPFVESYLALFALGMLAYTLCMGKKAKAQPLTPPLVKGETL